MTLDRDKDHQWLNLALTEAKQAETLDEVPVGAVLVSAENQLIATAHNQPISTHNATAHAEIEVLKKAGAIKQNYRLPETTLYVTLEPCPMCTGALIHARVKRVVFAARDLRSGACGTVFDLHDNKSLNHRLIADFIECKEAIALLRTFFQARRQPKNN